MSHLKRAAGAAALAAALAAGAGAAEAAVYRAEFRPEGASRITGSLLIRVAVGALFVSGVLGRVPGGRTYGLLISGACGEYDPESSILLASHLAPGGDQALSVNESLAFDFRQMSTLDRLDGRVLNLIEQTNVVRLRVSFPLPVSHAACGEIVKERP